jgi:hypothetical protein
MLGLILHIWCGLKMGNINFYTKSSAHGFANCHCQAIFCFPSGHALMLKKLLMYKQHKSRSELCVTLPLVLFMYPHILAITLKIGKGYCNIILHVVAHPKDLVLYVCKRYANILDVESFWFRRLVMKRYPKVKLPTCHQFVSYNIPNMVAKIMDRYVLLLLVKYAISCVTFDLSMSKTRFDTFYLVVNFIYDVWQAYYVTIRIFKTPNTTRHHWLR